VAEILQNDPPPHKVEFCRYPWRQNEATGRWYSFQQLGDDKK
jgi:hypothetical protein